MNKIYIDLESNGNRFDYLSEHGLTKADLESIHSLPTDCANFITVIFDTPNSTILDIIKTIVFGLTDTRLLLLAADPKSCSLLTTLLESSSSVSSFSLLNYFESKTSVLANIDNLTSQDKEKGVSSTHLSCAELEALLESESQFNLYQPQFSFYDKKIVGSEVFCRIEHPERGVILPYEFIDKIEHCSNRLNFFEKSFIDSLDFHLTIDEDLKFSFNLPEYMLIDSGFVNFIISSVEERNIPSHLIYLELMESSTLLDSSEALFNICLLKHHGFNFSIDDFGTEHSIFNKLVKIPFSEIKIDKQFILESSSNRNNNEVIQLTINIAKTLGMKTVAEGVEDERTWLMLRSMGADTCQGFYTSKPISASAFRALIESNEMNDLFEKMNCLVVDDHPVICSSLSMGLNREGIVNSVTSSNTIKDAISILEKEPINFIALDVDLGTHSGLELISYLKKINYMGKLVILTSNELLNSGRYAGNIEKLDVISKSNNINDIISDFITTFSNDEKGSVGDCDIVRLSPQEREVAIRILQGLNNKRISNEMDIDQKTVSTYKNRILEKFRVENIHQLKGLIIQ